MTAAFFITWLNHQGWFNAGANDWQWLTSIIACAGWGAYFHERLHDGCHYCKFRKGVVPIQGTVHKACKVHAEINNHSH